VLSNLERHLRTSLPLRSMSDIKRDVIKQSLKTKGFQQAKTGKSDDHEWYIFSYNDKKYPQVCVMISRGSGYKTYGDSLIRRMKRGLQLDQHQQVFDLLTCPMTANQYVTVLIQKKIINTKP